MLGGGGLMREWEVEEKSGPSIDVEGQHAHPSKTRVCTLSSSGAPPMDMILPIPDPSLTAGDVQTGRAKSLASGVGGNACVGALVLSAYVQQDQAMLLGRAGHGVARGIGANPQHSLLCLLLEPMHTGSRVS